MALRYRVSNTLDPEERLEDAAMSKAMHDALGCEIVSEGDADFGRDKMFGGVRKQVAYWLDPAFLENAGREVKLCDFNAARHEVSGMHRKGMGAFIKATDLKLFTCALPVGSSFDDAVGDMAYSLIDRPPCIMVQPLCDMKYEMRFASVGRRIVASSPVAWHLTPASRIPEDHLFETPRSTKSEPCYEKAKAMADLASNVAQLCREENVVIDCAMIGRAAGVIEFNPFSIGNFGLYNCDPAAIANAYAGWL